MRERGDLSVLHEPFMYDYYMSGGRGKFAGFAPEVDHPVTYEGIRTLIRQTAQEGPVFFKDMGYYVCDTLSADPDFACQMSHAFLIRDPAESVISYAKKQADFSLEEVGLEAQWRLYLALVEMGIKPTILPSVAIRANPAAEMARYWRDAGLADAPHALRWEASAPQDWRAVEAWHQEVIQSTGIAPPDTDRDVAAELAALGAPYVGYVAHHQPYFDKFMAAHAHQ